MEIKLFFIAFELWEQKARIKNWQIFYEFYDQEMKNSFLIFFFFEIKKFPCIFVDLMVIDDECWFISSLWTAQIKLRAVW